MQHLYWWHQHNAALANMNIDGRVWFFIPVTQIAEVFPYLSEKVVRGILDKLIQDGYLVKDHKGEGQQKFNRTNWYAFTPVGLGLFELPVGETPFAPEGKSIVNSKVIIKVNNNNPQTPLYNLPYDSEEFRSTWAVLIKQPKWRGKSKDALAKSAELLGEYPQDIAIKMMNASIRNGWQGLFPLKLNDMQQQGAKTSSAQSRAREAREAAEAELAATLAAEQQALIEGGVGI